jgi:multiple sugar transport system permease protein
MEEAMAITQRRPAAPGADKLVAPSLLTQLRKALPAYLFILPGVLLFLVWTLYPLLQSLVMSFAEWNLIKPSRFVGLQNYTRAFADQAFWVALKNTLQYVVITVPGQMLLGLLIALLLDGPMRARNFFRAIYYIPAVTSWVVVSLLFRYLFNSQSGLVNYLLRDILGVIGTNISWLSEPGTANIVIALLGIWKGIGWTMVIFLAGLQSVPPALYEAAAIDGANAWQRLRYITLPLIRQTTLFITVMLTIGAFQVFISVYLLTRGGPLNRTDVLLSYMYKHAFEFLDLGYGSALSYIIAILIFALSAAQIRLLRRQAEY